MGQFLESMDKKWGKNPQYLAIRPDLAKIEALEVSLKDVMNQVYLPLQREYAKTTYGDFLAAQVTVDADGPAKAKRIEQDVKEKVKTYWQTIACHLQNVNGKNRDVFVDNVSIRSVMRAFIPGELDGDDEPRIKIIALAKQYQQNPDGEAANSIVARVQEITWISINKAPLMLVLEAGVGGEITSAKGLSFNGSARAGGCDAAGNMLKAEFKNLPEVDRLSSVSEGMSLILASQTAINQLSAENNIDRLELLTSTVLENIVTVVHGYKSAIPGQKQDGLTNLLRKLYQLELLECLLRLGNRKNVLVNAGLRKEIVSQVFEVITINASSVDLTEMLRLRTAAQLVARDCENESLSIREIIDRNGLSDKNGIAARALSPFRYFVLEAFPKLNTNLPTGLANEKREPITIEVALCQMERVLESNKEDIRKHYGALKNPGEALASTFGYLINTLNTKKPLFSKVIALLASGRMNELSSMSIAAFIESGLGCGVPLDKNARDCWKAIEEDLQLKKDPLVIALKSLRDMLKLMIKLQNEAQSLIEYSREQSKSLLLDASQAVALQFGQQYNSMVISHPQLFLAVKVKLDNCGNALNCLRAQSNIVQYVSSKDIVYTPKDELKHNIDEINKMNANKIFSAPKTLAMKLAEALHAFAVNETDSFQSFANGVLIELKTCTAATDEEVLALLKLKAPLIQTEVEKLHSTDRRFNFFQDVKSMVGFSNTHAAATPKDMLMGTLASINAYKLSPKMAK